MPGGSSESAAEGLYLDRGEVRAIICQIPDGDLAAMVLKRVDALHIHSRSAEAAEQALRTAREAATSTEKTLSRWLAHQFSHQEQFVVLREARDGLRAALTGAGEEGE